jgi:uncharacterized protein (DUF3084 family)
MVKELQQAKVDAINARAVESTAQRKLADTEADLKQAKDEAARATKEAQQAKADAQAARQSQAEAKRKLAEKQSQADPLGTWLRGFGAWLRGLVS